MTLSQRFRPLYRPRTAGLSRFLSTPSAKRATFISCISSSERPRFLSTPSARRATYGGKEPVNKTFISIHALREEGDLQPPADDPQQQISIHALREEGDPRLEAHRPRTSEFLSTPSARRATHPSVFAIQLRSISIHALREEGDVCSCSHGEPVVISIHALREEGDLHEPPPQAAPSQFLSTPSARRATQMGRKKADLPWNFYPRPPRGGRPAGPRP